MTSLSVGAYGLPKLRGSSDFKLYDDYEEGYAFEYPRSWVGRSNSLREGIYISDFNVRNPGRMGFPFKEK